MKATETWTDPIVDEVRRIRLELVKEAGGDLRSLVTWLAERRKLRDAAGETQVSEKDCTRSTKT